MQSPKSIDYLIVGQGLAGSILAWLLEKHRLNVMVVDATMDCSASRIAAGIVNPVAGQRLVKHPRAEILLGRARAFYANVGNFFKETFYSERPMIHLFNFEKERAIWAERKANPEYFPYLGESFGATRVWPVPGNRYGGFHQQNCGFLDTRRFLDAMRTHFESTNRLIEAEFSWHRIKPGPNGIAWSGYNVGIIISCEGFRATKNPYFSRLPFQLSKGEILTLESAGNLPDWIVNQGKWLLPLNRQVFKFGSTYERQHLDSLPSASAREALVSSARELLPENSRIRLLAQNAGIRPGSLDKNPFAGLHPSHPRLGIFNGFGSKGVLTIPYYAERFVRFLLTGKDLPTEIKLDRYPISDETG